MADISERDSQDGLILVVDDDRRIRELIAEALMEEGYKVVVSCDGEAALMFCRNSPDFISLVITDLRMPKMDGVDLCRHLSKERPEAKILVVTGHAEMLPEETATRLLLKPFRMGALMQEVRALLGAGS